MMKIKCLRSEPEIFDPIHFEMGLNIITGERSEDSKSGNKTNGVGKTLCINFLDFAFLSDFTKNKISKIPKEVFSHSTDVILDLELNEKNITIKRNITNHGKPIIYTNGIPKNYEKIDEAKKYLFTLLYPAGLDFSFRSMFRIFKRTENTGYDNLTNPDSNQGKDISPYLYLFNFNINEYKKVSDLSGKLQKATEYIKKLKEEIANHDVSIEEAAAYVNDLKAQLEAINNAVENLTQDKIYDTISEDIASLDIKLEDANLQLVSIKEELKKISNVPEYQDIPIDDISAVYNDLQDTLGEFIVKDIKKIQEFKNIIDQFKNKVLKQRKDYLLTEKDKKIEEIKNLSELYKRKISVLDQSGNLKSFKTSLHEQQSKKREYDEISFLYHKYEIEKNKKANLATDRNNVLINLRKNKEENSEILKEFQETVLEIHEYLYGNKRASFEIEIKEGNRSDQKNFIDFKMQIDDSGSARTEHEKILIFDLALLFCPKTQERHIGTIIHDGAFEGVNETTKHQIMNWLHAKQMNDEKFQYIVTINRDSFEALEEKGDFSFKLNDFVRAQYTKEDRFVKQKYIQKT